MDPYSFFLCAIKILKKDSVTKKLTYAKSTLDHFLNIKTIKQLKEVIIFLIFDFGYKNIQIKPRLIIKKRNQVY